MSKIPRNKLTGKAVFEFEIGYEPELLGKKIDLKKMVDRLFGIVESANFIGNNLFAGSAWVNRFDLRLSETHFNKEIMK